MLSHEFPNLQNSGGHLIWISPYSLAQKTIKLLRIANKTTKDTYLQHYQKNTTNLKLYVNREINVKSQQIPCCDCKLMGTNSRGKRGLRDFGKNSRGVGGLRQPQTKINPSKKAQRLVPTDWIKPVTWKKFTAPATWKGLKSSGTKSSSLERLLFSGKDHI